MPLLVTPSTEASLQTKKICLKMTYGSVCRLGGLNGLVDGRGGSPGDHYRLAADGLRLCNGAQASLGLVDNIAGSLSRCRTSLRLVDSSANVGYKDAGGGIS